MFKNVIRFLQMMRMLTWVVIGLCVIAVVMIFTGNEQHLLTVADRYEVKRGATSIKYVATNFIFVVMIGGLITQHVFRKIIEIVRASAQNNPFMMENVTRLREIGWTLIGLQGLFLGSCLATYMVSEMTTGRLLINLFKSVEVIGLIAALLMFVLARVFQHGVELRHELEGTV
jgi:Protein of unknown function (DUF2975)